MKMFTDLNFWLSKKSQLPKEPQFSKESYAIVTKKEFLPILEKIVTEIILLEKEKTQKMLIQPPCAKNLV